MQGDPAIVAPSLAWYVGNLGIDLLRVGRVRNSVQLFHGYLGLTYEDYFSRDFGQVIKAKTKDLWLMGVGTTFVINLAQSHVQVGEPCHAVLLCYAILGFLENEDRDFRLRDQILRSLRVDVNVGIVERSAAEIVWLRHRLGRSGLDAESLVSAVTQLAQAFGELGQEETAVQILMAAIPGGQHVPEFLGGLEPNSAVHFLTGLGDLVIKVGRPAGVVRMFEQFLNLPHGGFGDADVLQHLRRRMKDVDIDNLAAFVRAFANCLEAGGRHDDAARVIDAFAGDFGWFDDLSKGPSLQTTVLLLENWLRRHGQHETTKAQAICRRILPWLRRCLGRRRLSGEDRTWFAQGIHALRAIAVELCRVWATTSLPDDVKEWNSIALALDVELGQRALLEQFLSTPVMPVGDDGAKEPANNWPIVRRRIPSDLLRRWGGHLPPANGGDGFDPACNALPLCAFDTLSDTADADNASAGQCTPPAGHANNTGHETVGIMAQVAALRELDVSREHLFGPMLDTAAKLVSEGLPEEKLARELGANTLLLRAMFSPDGTLRWRALLSHGDRLETVADNLRAEPSPNDFTQLRWAAAHHDLEVSLPYHAAGQSDANRWRTACERLVQRAREMGGLLAGEAPPKDHAGYVADFLGVCREAVRGESLASLFEIAYLPLVARPRDPAHDCGFLEVAIAEWAEVERVFAANCDLPRVTDFTRRLDDITQRYLNRVAAVWNLRPLGDALSRLSAQPDVVVQVDDVLHAVPVAHLPLGGKPLFACVRSVRSSLSPLLDALQHGVEQAAVVKSRDNARLLAVSYFRPSDSSVENDDGDPAGQGAEILHHGQQVLAATHGLEYLGAAERPEGRRGTLLKGLRRATPPEETPVHFRAVTVLGHGHWEKAGVILADGLYNGEGADLSGVELLISPSCTIGRIQQSGQRDVEGFCVRLALHRARSVLACRWKVNAYESPMFANEVIAQYLELRKTCGPQVPGAYLRACALNEARKKFLDDSNRRVSNNWPGLNTAAAFELYGLG